MTSLRFKPIIAPNSPSTVVCADKAPDDAILKEAARRKHNLVVMGVGRRPGEKLFFGDTAAALLKMSECSLLFVAS
jgi:nucleotide-binding universal stress UspA family protein